MSKSPSPHRRNYNIPGHAHELTFSCYHSIKFFTSDEYCKWLIDSFEQARQDLNFDIWAFVIMPEHVHILVHPRKPFRDIEDIRLEMKASPATRIIEHLTQTSSPLLKEITRQRGTKTERLVWQSGGGYDRNIDNPSTLAKSINYIHLNPVRKGLVQRPEDWKWSSAAWYAGSTDVPLIPDPIPPEWLTI